MQWIDHSIFILYWDIYCANIKKIGEVRLFSTVPWNRIAYKNRKKGLIAGNIDVTLKALKCKSNLEEHFNLIYSDCSNLKDIYKARK